MADGGAEGETRDAPKSIVRNSQFETEQTMKLILAVIQNEDEDALTDTMEAEGLSITRIGSSGGFMRASNVTLMMAVQDELVSHVIELFRTHCKRRTKHLHPWAPSVEARERFLGAIPVEVGGATVFILSLDQMEKIG
jgi:uncharacterized protein YaaQ